MSNIEQQIFLKNAMNLLREKDISGILHLISGSEYFDLGISELFKFILNHAKNVKSPTFDVNRLPAYDSTWMPGNLAGLDAFKELYRVGDICLLPKQSSFQLIEGKITDFLPDTITVLSGDSNYVNLFFDAAYESFRLNRIGNDVLVLHITNPDTEILNKLISKNDSWFFLTYDFKDRPPLAYYACSRYLAANYFLDKFHCPVIISDMDVNFLSSPSVVQSLKNPKYDPFTIDLCVDDPPRLPWQVYLAGFVYLRFNEKSSSFLTAFSNALEHVLNKNLASNWYLDQNILFFLFNSGFEFIYGKAWSARDRILKASDAHVKEKNKIKL